MTFKFRYADKIVGLFVLVALLFVIFMLIEAGVNRQWFSHQYRYVTRFTSANGLSVGMAIKFKGVEVGEIKSFSLNDDNLVDAEFVMYEKYFHKLTPNSVLELSTNPLGIGGGLILYQGRNSLPPPEEGSLIPSTQFPSARIMIDQGLVDKEAGGDVVGELMASLPALLDNVNAAISSVNELTMTVNQSLAGDRNAGPVAGILREVEDSTAQIEPLLVRADSLLNQVDRLLTHTTDLLAQVRNAEDLVPTLVGTEGVVGGLISDDAQFYGEIEALTGEILISLTNLSDMTGSLNRYSPKIDLLLSKLSSTLDKAEDVMEGLTNNPLLKGGIDKSRDVTPSGGATMREEDF